MRRLIAASLVGMLLLAGTVAGTAGRAFAGTSTDVALGLASFAVLNQLLGTLAPRPVVHTREVVVTPPPTVVYTPAPPAAYVPPLPAPPAVYAPATVYAAPPAPVIAYPTGHYELRRHAHRAVWVWVPTVVVYPVR
jgi:hypothetical protein